VNQVTEKKKGRIPQTSARKEERFRDNKPKQKERKRYSSKGQKKGNLTGEGERGRGRLGIP